jgi:hypothetical protein
MDGICIAGKIRWKKRDDSIVASVVTPFAVCYSLGLPTPTQLLEAATAKEKRGLTMNAKHRIISLLCC